MSDSDFDLDNLEDDDFLSAETITAPAAGADQSIDLKELKATLDRLEEANKGLLKDLQKERGKRQQTQGRLDQVTSTVNSILEQREQLISSRSEEDEKTLRGIPVEFTEDGDGFIPVEKLAAFTSKYEDEIAALKEQLNQNQYLQQSDREYQHVIDGIVAEKEEYQTAYNKYRAARAWANNKVNEFTMMNNINGSLNSGQALDFVFEDEGLQKEFATMFPGIDLERVVLAEDSRTMMRRALDNISNATRQSAIPARDARFQRVVNKPSTFGRSADAKGGALSLSDKVGNLSASDILNLKDEQIEALSNYLKGEEQRDGIIW